ncbi:MAG TPA: hypothetical protein VFT21_02325 [Gemmatimonadaceae bacterium]|nr:hypothetical protein [Gemmatimonadaceae bacterium]
MAAKSNQAGTRALILMLLVAVLPDVAAAHPGDKRHGHIYYTLIDLGTLGGPSAGATEVNSSGQVVGSSLLAPGGPGRAYLYSDGSMKDLGTLGGMNSQGVGINDLGQVVGNAEVTPFNLRGFLYSSGRMLQLDEFGIATAINNRGQVTGTDTNARRVLLYAGGQTVSLGNLGGSGQATGNAINERGEIVGVSSIANGDLHAFHFRNGQMVDLGTLGGSSSGAEDINERGHITGGAELPGAEFTNRAFLYRGGRMRNLGTLGGTNPHSTGFGINNFDVVVGVSWEFVADTFVSRAFIYRHGRMRDLNDLIDPTSPLRGYVTLTSAYGVNDLGWIAANGHDASRGENRAYLLRPIRVKRNR